MSAVPCRDKAFRIGICAKCENYTDEPLPRTLAVHEVAAIIEDTPRKCGLFQWPMEFWAAVASPAGACPQKKWS